LKRAGIRTIDDLASKSYQDLMRVRNLGKKNCEEVIRKLKEAGFSIKDEQ
jgi:DNA-directed RNA polymerase subunit alpha